MLGERKPKSQNKKKSNEPIDKKEKKIDIPKEFIKKIKKLGMREDDAEILFKSKIDWTAVYSENKIYCPEVTCDYFTKIDNGQLTDHLISVHQYGEYPCQHPHCSFTGVSKVSIYFIPHYIKTLSVVRCNNHQYCKKFRNIAISGHFFCNNHDYRNE